MTFLEIIVHIPLHFYGEGNDAMYVDCLYKDYIYICAYIGANAYIKICNSVLYYIHAQKSASLCYHNFNFTINITSRVHKFTKKLVKLTEQKFLL